MALVARPGEASLSSLLSRGGVLGVVIPDIWKGEIGLQRRCQRSFSKTQEK